MVSTVKLRRPAMPVMKRWLSDSFALIDSIIIVPGLSGSLELRMFRGMFFSLTGRMNSSCSTDAPMKDSSRSSA